MNCGATPIHLQPQGFALSGGGLELLDLPKCPLGTVRLLEMMHSTSINLSD